MHDIAIIFFSGVALLLLPLPIPLHLRARNSSTLLQIAWLWLGTLLVFVNSIIWWDNVDNSLPVWCDISNKILLGIAPGLSACSLCINRRLAAIASSRSVTISQRKKNVSIAIDLGLCLGVPMLVMALSYIVQPHRFNILEGFGCQTSIWPTLATLLIVYLWPCLLSLISIVYGAIAIKFFLSRRLQFHSLLKTSQSGLDAGHYVRLMIMASADLILGLPLTLFFLVSMARALLPWTSFADIHYGWSFVDQVPAASFNRVWENSAMFAMYVATTWLCPTLSFIFFLMFGVTEDAITEYLRWSARIQRFYQERIQGRQSRVISRYPQLGSTIVNTQGTSWRDSLSAAGDEAQDAKDHQSSFKSQTTGYHQRQIPVSIAVNVEREIV